MSAKKDSLKIDVILESGGDNEIARERISIRKNASGDEESVAIQNVIETWLLSAGDVIRIVEVQS